MSRKGSRRARSGKRLVNRGLVFQQGAWVPARTGHYPTVIATEQLQDIFDRIQRSAKAKA